MTSLTGIKALIDYTVPAGDPAKVQALIDLLPDSDSASSSGSQAGSALNPTGAGFLDEISPGAAVQFRVELIALKAAVT